VYKACRVVPPLGRHLRFGGAFAVLNPERHRGGGEPGWAAGQASEEAKRYVATALFGNYARSDLSFDHGEGVWLETADGRRFLDCAAGIAVNSLGHSHPHLVEALQDAGRQALARLQPAPDSRSERLATALTEATFADKVLFTNSGAEALECAIKTARRYFYVNGQPERYHIITFEGAFHGRTLATIAAGGQAKYLEGFGPEGARLRPGALR
jgi:acetylornithine/N-succinyldiaminopimelate aminotransferase